MQPALRLPVPSRSLLRFLKSQSNVAFLAPSSANSLVAAGSRLCRRGRTPEGLNSVGVRSPTTSRGQRHVGSRLCAVTYPCRDAPPAKLAKLGFCTTAARRELFEPKPDSEPTWQQKLWGKSVQKGPKLLKPDDLPAPDEFEHGSSMFTNRRTLAAKAALEPRLRCTEVDENGKVILVDGEFKKTELIAKFGLNPRDLRKIDSSNLPHILIRPSAILLNLLHLKVLIKHDRVLLFDVYGSKTSYPQSAFMYDLQGKLQQKTTQGASSSLPYEFRALEAVLTSVTSEMEADFEAVREPVMRILSELEDDIDRDKLRILLILSKRVSTFEQKAKLVRDAIEELLEADDDLAAMYLTEKTHDLYRGLDDHTEVEMLLESYHKLTDEIVQEAGNLVSGIRNTEEIVRAILDANRNSLMLLDLKFSVGTLGLAMGTFLAGLYGMNLENFIEETNWGFGAVTGMSTLASIMVCGYGLIKLRKVQRIKMMRNERPHVPRSSQYPYQYQYHDDSALGLLDSRNREMLRRAHMQKAMAARRSWLPFWKA
ncbi:inner membrane magnesium transporter MRS2 precursor [Metarhizium album ARSEF 1941]|uniref:Magnesium transporter n=1 Tax=Metarhizium album (strain ARSEF 1941) TaxID=1081103 RepID=A0A0B2WXN2_METAS|nr:inner membrane magnesium transporter MRS2 precursor [Metarhizium album ARSEF 1941]KHN98773.1 inner membrane magnesium transporter MRS2 precursor [Metarhizium album ARSEF 1941]